MAKTPLELAQSLVKKPRDDAYTQKMNEYYTKRKALLDSKDDKHGYLGPEWNALSNEIRQFREGYEPSRIYSPREYLLENDLDEFQIENTRDDVSLEDIWNAMQNGEDFYKYASVNGEGFDSAVREKIFSGMSDHLGLDYDNIYDTWLYGKKKPKVGNRNPVYNVDNGNPNQAQPSINKGDTFKTNKGETFIIGSNNNGKVSITRVGDMGQQNGTIDAQKLSELIKNGTFIKEQQNDPKATYQSILKKAFNSLDKNDAFKEIQKNPEVYKAFQKVQRENPDGSFWYQLSLLSDELYGGK